MKATSMPEQLSMFLDRTPRSLMCQAIKTHYPASEHGAYWHKHFTDLAYKYATGYNAQGLKRFVMSSVDRNITDALTQEEMNRVQKAYREIANEIEAGRPYEEIRDRLMKERRELYGDS